MNIFLMYIHVVITDVTVFLDFTKAFDKLNHKILMEKVANRTEELN